MCTKVASLWGLGAESFILVYLPTRSSGLLFLSYLRNRLLRFLNLGDSPVVYTGGCTRVYDVVYSERRQLVWI